LLNRTVARRAFGVLGATEAVVEMAAFLVALVAAGWRPGFELPTGDALLAASGAAFAAVVIGQAANVFACRSSTRRVDEMPAPNRLLRVAVAVELAALAVFLFVPSIADLLDQQAPPLAGWLVASATAPAVLLADSVDKASSRRRRAVRGADTGAGARPAR
jgi:hypothetical protein